MCHSTPETQTCSMGFRILEENNHKYFKKFKLNPTLTTLPTNELVMNFCP